MLDDRIYCQAAAIKECSGRYLRIRPVNDVGAWRTAAGGLSGSGGAIGWDLHPGGRAEGGENLSLPVVG